MGRGPQALVEAGLIEALASHGHEVVDEEIRLAGVEQLGETQVAFRLVREIALRTRHCRQDGALPVVLSGSCYAAAGVASGLAIERLSVAWFDAHADFNTPETTQTGYLDGMGAAMMAGLCWLPMMQQVPGFRPVPPRRIVWLGLRDVDPGEGELLALHDAAQLPPGFTPAQLDVRIERLANESDACYLHLDPDVLDLSEGRGNALSAHGGMSGEDLDSSVRAVAAALPLAAVTFASYDPELDDGRIARRGIDLLVAACAAARPAARA